MNYVSVIVLALLFLASGCSNHNEELEQLNATLQKNNTQLNQDLSARDEYVNKITDSINAIYVSIENLKSRENSLIREKAEMETSKKLSSDQIRSRLFDRVDAIRGTLSDNFRRLRDLESRLAKSKKQYAGLQKLVESMKKTIEERDRSIAELGRKIEGLERDVHEKTTLLSQRDSVIGVQHSQITTAYYISGTRDDLRKMGLITKEGGFLWGLLGSTTTLASGFDPGTLKPVDRTQPTRIQVDGKIDEIVPKRNAQYYQVTRMDNGHSTITISDPAHFWNDKYLVIITDRPGSSALLSENDSLNQ